MYKLSHVSYGHDYVERYTEESPLSFTQEVTCNNLPCGMIGKIVIEQGTYSGTSPYMDESIAEDMAKALVHAINSHDNLVEKIEIYKEYIEYHVLRDLQSGHPLVTIGKELLAMK